LANRDHLPNFFASQEKAFDLKALLYHYLMRYWYLYLIFPVMGYFGAWVYLRYTVPEYEVKCSLLIKDAQKGSGLSETALLKELGVIEETKNIENEIQVLKSQTLMEEVGPGVESKRQIFRGGAG
jgi:tyrosine-protein kinase Etk/Wzc